MTDKYLDNDMSFTDQKVDYLSKLMDRFGFNEDFKNGFMFFLGGSTLVAISESQIEDLQIARDQISKFDINQEYKQLLEPLKDIYIQSFFEEFIWRLGVKLQTKKIKLPHTNIEVSEFEFKNHQRLDLKETFIEKIFDVELSLNQMLEGVGKELSSQGYELIKSFKAGVCFFNLKAQVDEKCTTEVINTINSNLSPIVDWITMVGRTPTVTLDEKYLDIQIALHALIRGEDREFCETLWGFQSYVLYYDQKEISNISNLSSEEFQKHCRHKAIYYFQSVEKEPLLKLAKRKNHITMFPTLVSQVNQKLSFNDVFKDTFGNPKSQGYHCDVHLKCLIIYSYFNVICETVLSSIGTNEIDFQLTKELAEAGDCVAQFKLALIYDNKDSPYNNTVESFKLYKFSAENGHAPAQYNLALKYIEDPIIIQDFNEAIRLLKLASNQGYIPSHNQLGYFYENGFGTDQNYLEALKYYKIASDNGDPKGQFSLGCMYEHGLGVEKDYIEAIRLYKISSNQDYTSSYFNLGVMYQSGKGVEIDLKEAMKYYNVAVKKGHGKAMYNIGTIYGSSSEYNVTTLMWFYLADANGISSSKGMINELENEMSMDQIENSQNLLKEVVNGSIDPLSFLKDE